MAADGKTRLKRGTQMVSRLRRVELREVWRHEAADFTTWLRDNIDVLNDALGLSLSGAEREQSTGNFSVDLVAEDQSGNPVAIENQLERSNHDHLGKVLTYLAAIEAKTAIWIVSEPRPEHVKAIAWLNEAGVADFYLVKVEAVRIDESPPAPLLTLIVGPGEEARRVGETKKELSERHGHLKQFWGGLLEKARPRTNLLSAVGVQNVPQDFLGKGAGRAGLVYYLYIRRHDAYVELNINRSGDLQANQQLFEVLLQHRREIDAAFGEPLDWEQPTGRTKTKRIASHLIDGGLRDEERWPEIQDKMIDVMVRMESAFHPFVATLAT